MARVGALSIWSDQFTILGGTGTGNVLMKVGVSGVIQSGLFEGAFAILLSEEAPSAAEILAIAASVSTEPVPPLGTTVLFYDEGSTDEGDFGPVSAFFSQLVPFT